MLPLFDKEKKWQHNAHKTRMLIQIPTSVIIRTTTISEKPLEASVQKFRSIEVAPAPILMEAEE